MSLDPYFNSQRLLIRTSEHEAFDPNTGERFHLERKSGWDASWIVLLLVLLLVLILA